MSQICGTQLLKEYQVFFFVSSALMSLGLLLDGILYLLPDYETPCYQYKVVYRVMDDVEVIAVFHTAQERDEGG